MLPSVVAVAVVNALMRPHAERLRCSWASAPSELTSKHAMTKESTRTRAYDAESGPMGSGLSGGSTPLRPLVAEPVEAVQDQIEAELERMLVALRHLAEVLLRVFVGVRVFGDREPLEDGLREIL